MQKTLLFGAVGFVLYYLGKKGKALYHELTDTEKISLGITGFGKPVFSGGAVTIPLELRLLNATTLSLNVDDLLAKVYTINKQGVKTLLFQNTPEGVRGLTIKPNATSTLNITLTSFLSNLIFSSLSVLQTRTLLIELYPKIGGVNLPKQELFIPVNLLTNKS